MGDLRLRTDSATTLRVHPDGRLTLAGEPLFWRSPAVLLERIRAMRTLAEPVLVVTPNVDQTIDLDRDPEFRGAYQDAALRLIDGAPLTMLARLLGATGVHRHTGADLLPFLVGESEREGWTIAIAGGDAGVSRLAVARLQEAHPGANVVSVPFPHLAVVDDPRSTEVIDDLRALSADIVFLCLGAPKQEMWFMHWRSMLPPGVYIGAGAAVDFAAGTARRAPSVLRRLGAEWLWRLVQEPKRLKTRYLVKGPAFLAIAWRSILMHDRWGVHLAREDLQ
ncbi:N-acetylglucosaminyldiphosphoundecaprenol N-acetyl-beta-D-mannosaminyltransferase [Mycetocola sp. CAN_C7]|uniref:WecB/TagA/CpsF family glycosyltransferase n=1 Tax=Mycetocola sp. CAN_C7 TaxID=2787724 RepID=UPI0018C92201